MLYDGASVFKLQLGDRGLNGGREATTCSLIGNSCSCDVTVPLCSSYNM